MMRGVAGLLLMTALAGGLAAQNTPALGGTGGSGYTLMCPEGYVLTMLSAKQGMWMDRISGWCYEVNLSTGNWITENQQATSPSSAGRSNPITGGSSGTCPMGHAVKTFKVQHGSFIHRITFKCRKMGSGGRTGSTVSSTYSVGVNGPTETSEKSCPDAMPAIGVHGKSGEYVDSFGLVCGYIMPGAAALLAPTSGSDVISKRPLFDWDAAPRINKPYKICLNLSAGADCSITGTLRAETTSTKWTPTSDLPFTRGDVVYWRVDSCNDNGCKSASRSFRYMP